MKENQIKEKDIAEKTIKPFLLELGFFDSMISRYGIYPIHIGGRTFFADYVCHIGMEKDPYLIVEVKTDKEDFDIYQVQSYALLLNAPFFALTDGQEWKWFMTGNQLEEYQEIDRMPIPIIEEQIITRGDWKSPSDLLKAIRDTFDWLSAQGEEHWFFKNLDWHMTGLNEVETYLQKVSSLRKRGLEKLLTSYYLMNNKANNRWIRKAIHRNIQKVKESLELLTDDSKPLETRYDELTRKNSDYQIPGIGPMVITRLLAAHNYDYFTIDKGIMNQLIKLGLITSRARQLTGREYINLMDYFNPLHDYPLIEEYGMEVIHYLLWVWDDIMIERVDYP